MKNENRISGSGRRGLLSNPLRRISWASIQYVLSFIRGQSRGDAGLRSSVVSNNAEREYSSQLGNTVSSSLRDTSRSKSGRAGVQGDTQRVKGKLESNSRYGHRLLAISSAQEHEGFAQRQVSGLHFCFRVPGRNFSRACLIAASLCVCTARAQTNDLYGHLVDFGGVNVSGVAVTMSSLNPNPLVRNGQIVYTQPITHFTDANGFFSFHNVPWGQWEWDVPSSFLSGFVDVGTLGSNTVVSLSTNTYNISVYPTGFALANGPGGIYDASLVTNLNASQLASGTVPLQRLPVAVLTNNTAVLWNSTTNVISGVRTATELWVYPLTPYNQTNYPYSLIFTN